MHSLVVSDSPTLRFRNCVLLAATRDASQLQCERAAGAMDTRKSTAACPARKNRTSYDAASLMSDICDHNNVYTDIGRTA